MSPQKIYKLVMQGRLVPIIEKQQDGKEMLLGYRRKGNSRKSNQVIHLREPQELPDATPNSTGISIPIPKPIELTT